MGEPTEKPPFTPSFLTPGGRVRTPFSDGSNPSIEEISQSVPLIRTEEQLKKAREMIEDGNAKDLTEAAKKLSELTIQELAEDRNKNHAP